MAYGLRVRIHEVDPLRILPRLLVWEALSAENRRAWVLAPHGEAALPGTYGIDEHAMLDGGLLRTTTTDRRRIADGARPLRVLLRTAERCRVLESGEGVPAAVRAYLRESLDKGECQAVLGNPSQYGWDPAGDLARRAASRAWVEELVGLGDPVAWEKVRLRDEWGDGVSWEPLLTPAVHAALVGLVDEVREAGGTVRFSSLFEGVSQSEHEVRSAALQAALRYLVLFPRLQVDPAPTFQVGLAPGVARGLDRKPQPEPTVVEADVEATPTFWIADMMSVLLDAAAGETRVKANGSDLYQKTEERLVASLGSLPPLVEEWAQTDGLHRLACAVWALQAHNLVHLEIQPNGRRFLRPTPASQAWLAAPPVERVRTVADRIRAGGADGAASRGSGREAEYLAPDVSDHDRALDGILDADLAAAIRAALAQIPSDGAVGLDCWLHQQAYEANPLTGEGPGGHAFGARSRGYRWAGPEECELAWLRVLSSSITWRLIPLGGVALGAPGPGSEEPMIALTSVGRYVIRATDDLELPGGEAPKARVLVQPNFDVVFLGPAPEIESLLAPFAERVGHGVGTLFHLNRKAAMRAAAAGLDAEEALERLTRAHDGPLPENISRSVSDWFARVRVVESSQVLILRCPDEDTASRVAAAGDTHATRLGPQVVEIESREALRRIEKKLAKEGIFVEWTAPEEGYGNRPRRSRRRRRRW